jgi:hypothetical protein
MYALGDEERERRDTGNREERGDERGTRETSSASAKIKRS